MTGDKSRHMVKHGSQTNSQLEVGASKAKIDNRWQEFEDKQRSHFEEVQKVMAVNSIWTANENSQDEEEGAPDQKNSQLLETTASKASLSPPVTGHSRQTLKGSRPLTLNQAKAKIDQAKPKPIQQPEKHGIELVIEATLNYRNSNPNTQTLLPKNSSLAMTSSEQQIMLENRAKQDTEVLHDPDATLMIKPEPRSLK